jgi:hypothetical protein
MTRARFFVALAITPLLSMGTLLVHAHPAGAVTQPGITVNPNQTVEVTHDAPVGAGNAYPFFGSGPADCADEGLAFAYCDTIPLKLNVPDADLAKGFYALSFTLSWDATNIVIPGTGTVPDNALGLGVWDDPIVEDEDTPTTCPDDDPYCPVLGPSGGAPGGDEAYVDTWLFNEQPIRFGLVPKHGQYSITVVNYYGAAPSYKLQVSLVVPSNLADLSFEAPVDLSGLTPAGPMAQSYAPDLGTGEIPPTSLDLAGLGAADFSPDRDFSGLDLGDLDLSRNDIVRNAVRQGLRPPGDENALFLWLWLVILPVVALASGAVWLVRRRAAAFTV